MLNYFEKIPNLYSHWNEFYVKIYQFCYIQSMQKLNDMCRYLMDGTTDNNLVENSFRNQILWHFLMRGNVHKFW